MNDRRKDHETRVWFDQVLEASREDQDRFEATLRQLVHRTYRRFDELAEEAMTGALEAARVMDDRNITWED